MAKWITVVRKEFHRSIYKESGKLYLDFVFLTAGLMQLSDGRYVHIRWKATLCRPEKNWAFGLMTHVAEPKQLCQWPKAA